MPSKLSPALLVLFISLLLSITGKVYAETLQTTTLELNYRQADEVVSMIKPFLHPQGAISGSGFTIIIKTSAKNLQDIKELIAEIDVAQRDLMISVAISQHKMDQAPASVDKTPVDVETNETSSEISITEAAPKDTIETYGTLREDDKPQISQIRVTEGQWATINTGEAIPVAQRTQNPDGTVTETIVYKSVTGGFRILPRLHNGRLTVYVKPQVDKLSETGDGKIKTQHAETTLSGKPGQWLLLAGASEAEVPHPGSRVYETQRRKDSTRNIYLKVDVIEN